MQFEEERSAAWVEIFSTREGREAADIALAFEARGVAYTSRRDAGRFRLYVPAHQIEVAREELRVYSAESKLPRAGPVSIPYVGSGWPGVFVYVGVLLFVALAARQAFLSLDWLGAGRIDGARIATGEWWRNVTALSIHLDLDHLLGNLAFGSFYGYFVGRHLGCGLGWAAIVLTGTLGNAVNVYLQGADHRAIGASTAVFAALGILAAFTWRRGYHRNTPWRTRIAPIIAGIALLAYTGTGGENTDLGAHLFGFIAGIVGGLVLARFEISSSRGIQGGFGAAACALLVLSWSFALF